MVSVGLLLGARSQRPAARPPTGGSRWPDPHGARAGSAYVDVALVDVLTFLDDVFEVEPAAGTFEAAGAAAVHDGMLAAPVDL